MVKLTNGEQIEIGDILLYKGAKLVFISNSVRSDIITTEIIENSGSSGFLGWERSAGPAWIPETYLSVYTNTYHNFTINIDLRKSNEKTVKPKNDGIKYLFPPIVK